MTEEPKTPLDKLAEHVVAASETDTNPKELSIQEQAQQLAKFIKLAREVDPRISALPIERQSQQMLHDLHKLHNQLHFQEGPAFKEALEAELQPRESEKPEYKKFLDTVKNDYGDEVANHCRAQIDNLNGKPFLDIPILMTARQAIDADALAEAARLNRTAFNSFQIDEPTQDSSAQKDAGKVWEQFAKQPKPSNNAGDVDSSQNPNQGKTPE